MVRDGCKTPGDNSLVAFYANLLQENNQFQG